MWKLLSPTAERFCDRVSRRDALRLGTLATLGLGWPQLLAARAAAVSGGPPGARGAAFGRARRVILLYMWGGPAHQDTWDLKPQGPSATRGEFSPIATRVPGIHICEHFPLIARQTDKLAIIRSVTHDDNNHSTAAHAALTGRRHTLKAENFGARSDDFPHIGSVLAHLRPSPSGLPAFVALPEVIATTAGAVTPGQGGGLLGAKYDPFRVNEHPDREDFSIPALRLPDGVVPHRLADRRRLLEQLDAAARLRDRSAAALAMDAYYQQALDMLLAPATRRAFDLSRLPDSLRQRYGWHAFGQSVLLARQLVEAGVQLVTVYWHRERADIDTSWDTHARNFEELRWRLMPAVDRPIAALLEDLAASGLLDETLVIWNSEFGRTPKINARGGRDHWGACNSVVLAGGGVPGGQVFGASDDQAAFPTQDRVSQADIAATVYHLLGIDPHQTTIADPLGRPLPVALGEPIHKLLSGGARPAALPDPPLPAPQRIGPFTRMLMQRCVRFLALELGNPHSEAQWQLDGFGPPQCAADGATWRSVEAETAAIRYRGVYQGQFDYAYLVLHLAQPQTLAGVSLRIAGRGDVPLPEPLRGAPAARLWQIPLPRGWMSGVQEFALQLQVPGWALRDVALSGSEIRQRHLQTIGLA